MNRNPESRANQFTDFFTPHKIQIDRRILTVPTGEPYNLHGYRFCLLAELFYLPKNMALKIVGPYM